MQESAIIERYTKSTEQGMINSSQIKDWGVIGEDFIVKMMIDLYLAGCVSSLDKGNEGHS